jgi:diguanylate cyclase (GGDEF)-like protein
MVGRRPWKKLLSVVATAYAAVLVLLALVDGPMPWLRPENLAWGLVVLGLPMSAVTGLAIAFAARTELDERARTDALTGLRDRTALMTDGVALFAGAAPGSAALVLLDVDRLERLNETCGLAAGDELLRLTAVELRRAAGPFNRAYRIDGDAFAVLVDRKAGGRLAAALNDLESLGPRMLSCGHFHSIAMTVGFASCTEGETFESVFRRASAQLRRRKRAGPLLEWRPRESPADAGQAPEECAAPAQARRLELVHSRGA